MPDRLELLTERLAQAVAADAGTVRPPAFAHLERRARRGSRQRTAAGAALSVVLVLGAALLVRPLGSADGPLASTAAPLLLDRGEDAQGPWRLEATPGCYRLVRAQGERGACGLTVPPTLAEAAPLAVGDAGSTFTVVVGPAPVGTAEVLVTTPAGEWATGPTRESAGTLWFSVRLPGVQGVRSIRALDADGRTVSTYHGPDLPPPAGPAGGVQAPPPLRLAETDEFGRISDIMTDGRSLRVERVDMLGGAAAEQAAAEDGRRPENDYHLRERPESWERYEVAPDVRIWGSIRLNGAVDHAPVPLGRLIEFVDSDRLAQSALFHLDLEDGVVVGIEEQYLP